MSVVDKIEHYQRNIEKCSDNEGRMLHCISRLSSLPVTVQHLQRTGVGRTVNALRKYKSGVGDAAKALVAKWKAMVVNEGSSEGEEEDETYAVNVPESNDDDYDASDAAHGLQNSGLKSRTGKDYQNKSDVEKNQLSLETNTAECTMKFNTVSKNDENQINAKNTLKVSSNETTKSKVYSQTKETHIHKQTLKPESTSCSKDSRHSRNVSEKSDINRSEIDHIKCENFGKSSKILTNSKDHKSCKSPDQRSKKRKGDHISFSNEQAKKRRDSTSESISTLEKQSSSTGTKIKQGPSGKEREGKNEDGSNSKSNNSSSEKGRNDVSKMVQEDGGNSKVHNSEVKHKHNETISSDEKKNSKKDRGHHSKKGSLERRSSNSSSNENNKYERTKSHDKKKKSPSEESKKQLTKNKETKESRNKEGKETVKVKQELHKDEGIDCNSGASFAEALGMCTMSHSSRKRKDSSPNSSVGKVTKSEQAQVSPVNQKKLSTVKSEPLSGDELPPPLLLAPNVKLEPLNVDLASTLPEISPNYKPLTHLNPLQRREEDRALTNVIYAKNQRTKVYSGNKGGYTSVPSLYEICIRVLIENIDALEFTGGVPYDILKPVLERATADQLFMLEHYNPYLIEDTDCLWEFHCSREFRNKQRQEMESWREMYMRCLDEREEKLKTLTANIKQSIDKSLPVRSAKLAYVDNVVKPPRNVLKKQAKYGTANAVPASTSTLKQKLIVGGGSTTAPNITVPAPPTSRVKTSSGVMKKTKAPLMAKALQLIKGRYKR